MFSLNLHNPIRPTYRIHNRVFDNDLWMAFDLPDTKGNTVTVFIEDPDELRALVEVAQEALVQFERRVAIIAAINAANEPPAVDEPAVEAPKVSLEKALGPVGSF